MSFEDGMQFFGWLQQGMATDYTPPGQALQIPIEFNGLKLDTPEIIAAAHSVQLEVHYWTINNESEMLRLLYLGADAIITDNPELGAKVFSSHNSKNKK